MKKALVTGGTGFIGHAITMRLLKDEWDITVVDNMTDPFLRITGENLGAIKLIKDDICNMAEWKIENIDAVFHFAAHFANIRSLKEPMENVRVNMMGTMAVLEFCRHNQIKNLIYASSSGVYGGTGVSIFTEDMIPKPSTPYEVTKYAAEALCSGYCNLYDISFASPRFFNVYGIGDIDGEFRCVIPNFFKRAFRDEEIIITGENASRDFAYIDDTVDAVLAGLRHIDGSTKRSEIIYNIASGKEVKIVDLAKLIVSITKSKSKITIKEKRHWDNTLRRVGGVAKFKSLFPKEASNMRSIQQGLADSFNWYNNMCSS